MDDLETSVALPERGQDDAKEATEATEGPSIAEGDEGNEEEEEEELNGGAILRDIDDKLGMTEFITPASSSTLVFRNGKLKTIPQDFTVSEIDTNGSVVILRQSLQEMKNTRSMQQEQPEESNLSKNEPKPAEKTLSREDEIDSKVGQFLDAVSKRNVSLTATEVEALKELMKNDPNTDNSSSLVLSQNISDKSLRGFLHQTIRQFLTPFIMSSTTSDQRMQLIRASKSQIRQDQRRALGGDSTGPSATRQARQQKGKHVRVVLKKTNVDTNHCLNELSRVLKIPRKNFGISGTKDKRAVTTQLVTIRFCSVAHLLDKFGNGPVSFGPNQFFELGDAIETNDQAFLGGLQGNRFAIAIRDLVVTDTSQTHNNVNGDSAQANPASGIEAAKRLRYTPDAADIASQTLTILENWKKIGFVNYFGEQRFGTSEIATHHVGIAILNRNYVEAIDLLLKPRSGETEALKEVRERYQRTKDLQMFLQSLPSRCTAERAVVKALLDGKDPLNCLLSIPKQTLTMYLHAVQSLLFNRMAGLRIRRGGLQVRKGDLIKPSPSSQSIQEVKSGEDAARYSIHQVVLCLPGVHSMYPNCDGVDKAGYDAVVREMGITQGLSAFQHKSPRELLLTGSYRPLVCLPTEVDYQIVKYSSRDCRPLLNPDGTLSSSDHVSTSASEGLASLDQAGDKLALVVSFSLPAGTYATVALREIIRPSFVSN